MYSPLWKITHEKPSVSCTPPFGKSKSHQFCVLPPWKNHSWKAIGLMYSPLWKITVFGGRLFRQIRYTSSKFVIAWPTRELPVGELFNRDQSVTHFPERQNSVVSKLCRFYWIGYTIFSEFHHTLWHPFLNWPEKWDFLHKIISDIALSRGPTIVSCLFTYILTHEICPIWFFIYQNGILSFCELL